MTNQRHSPTCAYLIYHTRPCSCSLAKTPAADAMTATVTTQTSSPAHNRLRYQRP